MVDDLIDIFDGFFIELHVGLLPFFSFVGSSSSHLIVGILEVVHQVSSTLDSCICEFAYLFTVVSVPSPSVEFFVKLQDELSVDKISKSISNVTRVIVVDGQIQEIDSLSMLFPDLFKQHFF